MGGALLSASPGGQQQLVQRRCACSSWHISSTQMLLADFLVYRLLVNSKGTEFTPACTGIPCLLPQALNRPGCYDVWCTGHCFAKHKKRGLS